MNQGDQEEQVKSVNQSDDNAVVAPTTYFCLEDGQDSLIEGPCPICGKPMSPDNKELPGEKEVEDDKAHDGMEEKSKPEEQKSEEDVNEPEKYSLEDIKEAEQAKDEDLILSE